MKFCLIGEKLSHSYSAEIHAAQGIDYTLREIRREDIPAFLKEGYDGFNVTIPYKTEIIPYLDGVSPDARETGAVNTVVKKDGKYYGYNTDIEGLRYAIERKGVSLKGKRVMVLGTGGAAKAAESLCNFFGAAKTVKISRGGEFNYENCYGLKDTEIVINATPVGMFPNCYASPVDLSRFSAVSAVFDCVYNPFNTMLISQAKKLGMTCSDGLPMLIRQALAAEKLWGIKGGKSDEELIAAIYREKYNIVLCGMPSSGKSSVGKLIAELTGKKFTDTDEIIEKKTGKTCAEIIFSSGEKVFREMERKAVKEAAAQSGAVIATGGGAVMAEENVSALKTNGVVFYVKRDLDLLTAKNRPISARKGIKALFEEREKFYERAADFVVENNGELTDCAKNIAQTFEKTVFNPAAICRERCKL